MTPRPKPSAKRAKKKPKPRVIWAVFDCDGDLVHVAETRKEATERYIPAYWAYCPYRVVRFVEAGAGKKGRSR